MVLSRAQSGVLRPVNHNVIVIQAFTLSQRAPLNNFTRRVLAVSLHMSDSVMNSGLQTSQAACVSLSEAVS